MQLSSTIAAWYRENARDLPWRRPGFSPWGVLVSEIMLQQTPVARVIPRLEQWLTRWPTPDALAADSPAEAVRAWDRLGYPRRARLEVIALPLPLVGQPLPLDHRACRRVPIPRGLIRGVHGR